MTERARIRDLAAGIQDCSPLLLAHCAGKAGDQGRIAGSFRVSQLQAARQACLHLDAALVELRRSLPGVSRSPEWKVVEKLHQAVLVSLLSPVDRTPDVRRFTQRALRKRASDMPR